MTLKHDWTQHAAHKKYGCVCVVRDFKGLEVVCLDAGSIKSLFWKYFFSLLLSIPRSSLVLHFSVGILVIFTLIWFKVDIKWRKKLEQNSYSLYLCTKNKKDEVEQNISFLTKIISIFLLPSCPSSQLQEFWAVQHQINASYIQQWVYPYLGSSQFPLSVCQGALVGLVLGISLSFPRAAREFLLDQIWCGEGEQEGREGTGPIFFPSKMGVGLLVVVHLSLHLCAHANPSDPERTEMNLLLSSCKSLSSGLSSPGHREWGEIVWGDTSTPMAEPSGQGAASSQTGTFRQNKDFYLPVVLHLSTCSVDQHNQSPNRDTL